jgi:transposase-like protein
MTERGRPTKYDPSFAERAYQLCREAGLTDKQLATAFGVDKATINRWKHKYPDFCDSLKKGKDEFDSAVVEASLLKAAKGYFVNETTREPCMVKEKGEVPKIVDPTLEVTKRVRKHVQPNVTAIIFWLKNRVPDRWRDKQEIDLGGSLDLEAELNQAEKRVED